MTHTETAEAAERVRKLVEGEESGATLVETLRALPRRDLDIPTNSPGRVYYRMPECGCPIGGVCMNTACPHRIVVTC